MKKNVLYSDFLGLTKYQRFFRRFYFLSLKGMNYGGGTFIDNSGELKVFDVLNEMFEGKRELLFFDIGANQGQYTRALTQYFGKIAIIHAFEPSFMTYEMLLNSLHDNRNVITNNFGFSDKIKDSLLYTNEIGSGMASVYHRENLAWGIKMNICEEIKLTTIDSYCEDKKIDRINFMKLDIEGHEYFALQGAKRMIREKRIDAIQFEFGGCNIDSRTYYRDFYYLLNENYKIYRVLKDGLFDMGDYSQTDEIFMTVNYLAIKR